MAKKSKAIKSSVNLKNRLSKIELKNILTAVVVVIIVLVLGLLKNQFVAASVNGKQINRLELIRELEKREGKRALENLVSEELIMQEAKKKNINVSDEEINRELDVIEKSVTAQGQKLDDLLALQGLTRQQLGEEVKTQIILKKLVGKLEVTNKEVEDYIEKNKDSIPADAKMEEIKSQVKTQLEQDKVNQKIQSLVDELRKNARIEYLLKF